MRIYLFMLMMVISFSAESFGGRGDLSKDQILDLAKKYSCQYCHDHHKVGEFKRMRCEFIAYLKGGSWIVAAHPVYEDDHGKEAIVEGGDRLYEYSKAGKLLKVTGQ